MLLALALAIALAAPTEAQRKKKKGMEEEPTQVLEVLPEPPPFLTAETARVGFLVTPLSSKGLLSQQTRDALRFLLRNNRGAQIAKIRAWVAGTGDLRRVPALVAEEFTAKKQPLPVVSVIQVGELPAEGAQVLLEALTVERRAVNSFGLAFFSGQQALKEERTENPLEPVLPLASQSLENLAAAAAGVGLRSGDLLRVTCLVSSLADHAAVSAKMAQMFPAAALALVQLQRGPLRPVAECEGVGRLPQAPRNEVELLNPAGLPSSPNYSQVALVRSPKILFTDPQLCFGPTESDVKLAFERLKRDLEAAQSGFDRVFFTSYYPLNNAIMDQIRARRFDYLDRARPPASTMILFEGLPSLDAQFGVEVYAAARE